ncbi:MAG: hypothetical protein J2P47_03325 [Acetobacteraceae bacterium]|nr:hypothetical protein [Acetobacteraceae bacterium]
MDLTTYRASLSAAEPPEGISLALTALWWDAKGDWDRAHHTAMEDKSQDGAAVHAYLHRKEGDLSNARYWYTRAAKAPAQGTLDAEWDALAQALL